MPTGMIGQFLGSSFPKLRKGQLLTGPYEQIGHFHPQGAPVVFGALLKYGDSKKYYAAMAGNETDAALFAGIAVLTESGSPTSYPGTKTQYELGEAGNVLIHGSIAVELSAAVNTDADDVAEGGKVYMGTDGKVTPVATNGLAAGDLVNYLLLPELVFTGDVEVVDGTTLVGVRKRY